MQKEFWNLVNEGIVEVLCEPACIDALNDTPDMDLSKFLDEAYDMGWIKLTKGWQYRQMPWLY